MIYGKASLFLFIFTLLFGWIVYPEECLQEVLGKSNIDRALEAIRFLQSDTLTKEDWKTLKEQCIVNKELIIRRECMEKIVQIPKKFNGYNLFFLGAREKIVQPLLGGKYEKDTDWELVFLSKTAKDEDGYMRMLTAFQLSGIKGIASAKLLVDMLDSEFKKDFRERGVENPPGHYYGNDEVVRECVTSLAILSKDEKVIRYLVDYAGSEETGYCIMHILFKLKNQNARREVIAEGIVKTTSKWLKMELISDAMETLDVIYLPAMERAAKDDFKYCDKGGEWIYPVKRKAEEAIGRMKEKSGQNNRGDFKKLLKSPLLKKELD